MNDRKTLPVAVVVPCFNCATTVERALNSVLAQTCLPEQIIVVDDQSRDGTRQVLDNFRKQCAGIDYVVVNLPVNGGPGIARNRGLSQVSQPYVAFLDADDSWHPRKLEMQHSIMQAIPALSITGHRFIVSPDPEPEWTEPAGMVTIVGKHGILFRNCFPTPTVMLRYESWMQFDETKRYSEDYFLWLKIVVERDRAAAFIDAPLASLFKPIFGASTGLSANLSQIQLGELDNYRRLARQGSISVPSLMFFFTTSIIKYLRRLAVASIRRIHA